MRSQAQFDLSHQLALSTQTLNARAGFLCNYEVLQILRQQRDSRRRQVDKLHEAKQKRLSKLNRKPFGKEPEEEEVDRIQPQDLHTVTFEVRRAVPDSAASDG